MGRTPKTDETAQAKKDAASVCQKCLVMMNEGDLLAASWLLHEAVGEKRRDQAGSSDFKETVVIMLSFCATNQVPPPDHLVNACARLFKLKRDAFGDKHARVVFAAGYSTMDQVPATKLKNIGARPISLDTARNLKKDSEFRRLVEAEKLARTPQGQAHAKAIQTRAKTLVGLYGVIKKAASEPEPIGTDAPERKLKGYVMLPLSKQRGRVPERMRSTPSKKK